MLRISDIKLVESIAQLSEIPDGKVLINTINAYSYNNAQKDKLFAEALKSGDYLLPDGVAILRACHWLHAISHPTERVTGWDLFVFEMKRLEERASKMDKPLCAMFMGSSDRVLALITQRAEKEYPHLKIETYSPPYKKIFNEDDNLKIINAINAVKPDLLWIGMTAPKQEKWTYQNWSSLNINCHVGTIGAVFDFFAGTTERAPESWQRNGYEWLYRLIKEPRRMWRRYVIGNPEFFIRANMERFCHK